MSELAVADGAPIWRARLPQIARAAAEDDVSAFSDGIDTEIRTHLIFIPKIDSCPNEPAIPSLRMGSLGILGEIEITLRVSQRIEKAKRT